MKEIVALITVISMIAIPVMWSFYNTPQVMVLDLLGGEGGVYTSKVFSIPIRIDNATLNISVLMDTYLNVYCEIRAGTDYVRFYLDNMSMSYHFQYNILQFFGSLSSSDVSLTAHIDTDGTIQGVPYVTITYYGLF
jgi:hypothetical protein